MKKQLETTSADIEQTETGHFKMTGRLDFETVPLVWEKSLALFKSCNSLDIDFSAVTHSNSAGLALLIEWMRSARSNKQPIAFHHLPVQMQEIAKVCGVDKDLTI